MTIKPRPCSLFKRRALARTSMGLKPAESSMKIGTADIMETAESIRVQSSSVRRPVRK